MWRNDTKCNYMFMFPLKNLARKWLKWPGIWPHVRYVPDCKNDGRNYNFVRAFQHLGDFPHRLPGKLEDPLRPSLRLGPTMDQLPEAMSVRVRSPCTSHLELVHWNHCLVQRNVTELQWTECWLTDRVLVRNEVWFYGKHVIPLTPQKWLTSMQTFSNAI